jgi:membrane fusion protein (multidrug efflux system)
MRNKIKKLKPVFITCFLIIALALGYFFGTKFDHGNNSQAGAMPGMPAPSVTVMTVKKQPVQLYIELPGRVSAFRISEVRPQINGIIKKVKFTEGSFVKEGQQLYQIDPNVYQIALDNAMSNLKSVRAKSDRYKALLELDAVSKQEYDDITSALAQSQANVKAARTNLNYTKVYAPISGYIGKSNLTEGTLVTANQAEVLTTITQLDPIYVDMAQPSKDMLQLGDQKEIPVTLTTDDTNFQHSGILKFSEVFADETTDSVRLRALFSNENKKLIPGMFVNGKLHLKPFEAITVPQRATTRAPDGSLIVWIIGADNIVKPRPIKADQISGDSWVVTEGLADGETIVYEGFLRIGDGAKVNPTPMKIEEKK